MKLLIVGTTGLVGRELLKVIEERNLPFDELLLVASEKSVGKSINFKGKTYEVIGIEHALAAKPAVAIFSAGAAVSLAWAPRFAETGTIVIDNSSAWRMHPRHKLIVPEVNGHLLRIDDRIIANPNCATIQLVMALAPLHQQYRLKRVVVSTYQSVTGSGKAAVDQLMEERKGITNGKKFYPHPIDLNTIPHIEVFLDNGYTQEEMKIINETKKILEDDTIQVTATAVRLPTLGGHAESINAEFKQEFELKEVIKLFEATPGIVLEDDVTQSKYPMPLFTQAKDEVFVGRIRRDESQPCTLNLWVVADNLRKGAATNTVQIIEYLNAHSLVY
ncbi:MAG: aspartate-semialdehyde dehydrogenase [Cytophagales bacterium]|nr:aspartate-semialdehyde dehydrogenase [Cytophagales bacterium]